MERLGIIDLGSNSVRLVIVDISANGAHHQIENIKETVRLIGGTDARGYLTDKAIRYALSTMRLMTDFCKRRQVDHIIAVATAAVRQAVNRESFVALLAKETGVQFRTLSGEEEAYLGYLAAVNTMPQSDGMMADLGGGSLKLVPFEDRIHQASACLDFGAVSLTMKFHTHDKPDPADLARMENYLTESYRKLPWLVGKTPLIGLGGTFRSIARIFRKKRNYLPDITDSIELSLADVEEVYHNLAQLTYSERLQIPGLEPARADIIVAGAACIYTLLRTSQREKLIISTSSIRDGLLFEHLNRSTGDPIVLSVLTHHIDSLIHHYRLEEDHLRRVSSLAVTLFDQLQSLHGLGSFARRLLLVAGLLHELGVVINVEGKDKNTLYMLLNARLQGLSHRERVIAAYVAASHDDLYLVNLRDYIERGPLQESDSNLICQLASLLQIAHSLDRCHSGVVTQVRGLVQDNACTINVVARAEADLEIEDARRKSSVFKQVFGKKLSIH